MQSLTDYLTDWAARRPAAPAVEFQGACLSYAELDRHSAALARTLRNRGVGPGVRVGLWLRKSIESVVAIHGVLRAGAAYVPIDPTAPLRRVGRIVGDCGLSHVIANTDCVDPLLNHPDTIAPVELVVAVGPDPTPVGNPSVVRWRDALATGADPVPASGPGDPAYVLYTSGSTGTPKGVTLSHGNARAFVEWAVTEFGLGPEDRVASHAPLHFDLSILDLFATCRAGGCVVLIPEGQVGLGGALNNLVASRGVTVWYSVPNALARMAAARNSALLTGSRLRVVLFAGETFPIGQLRRLRSLVPMAELYNLYGPTETNVCTFHRVRPADVAPERVSSVPIGRPCPYATGYLVDEAGGVLDERPGQYGELCVAGDSVMLGYWGDEQLTAARLVALQRAGAAQVRAYRTGDMVRVDDELNYVFCGRKDHMVKIRGYRVELGEIESVLSAVANVREVACVAVGDSTAVDRIEAYLVPHSHPCEVSAIRRQCVAALPRYMVPERFHVVVALPRTGTGKIDSRALLES